MSEIVKFEDLQDRIIELRGQKVLLDADVAQIYGVETRDINKAVGNNPDKFPAGYVVELSNEEKDELVENFHRFNRLKHSTVNPKAFPEKGLYMPATILKSPRAVQATLAIIETFSKIRELSRNIKILSNITDKNEQKRKICLFTSTRAEYGLLRGLMQEVQAPEALQSQILASGAHLSPEFGMTVKEMQNDGFEPDETVEMLLSASPECKGWRAGKTPLSKVMRRLMTGYAVTFNKRHTCPLMPEHSDGRRERSGHLFLSEA
jgi:hypothetical protein